MLELIVVVEVVVKRRHHVVVHHVRRLWRVAQRESVVGGHHVASAAKIVSIVGLLLHVAFGRIAAGSAESIVVDYVVLDTELVVVGGGSASHVMLVVAGASRWRRIVKSAPFVPNDYCKII